MKVFFGDLPTDAQMMLTRHLRIDFSHCSFREPRWLSAWGVNDKGFIVGILTVEFQTWFHGKITTLVLDPRCVSRRALRAFFTAVFSRARRLTAEVEPDNRRSLQQVQRLGFTYEGYCPLGLEGTRDTIVFGMLKDECPWLRSYLAPSFSSLDGSDVGPADAVVGGNFKMPARVRANGQNLSGRNLGFGTAFHGRGAFEQVLFSGLPADVSRVDANAIAARMGGVQLAGRAPVRGDADHAMHTLGLPVQLNVGIPVRSNRMRPKETTVAGIRQRGGNGLRS